MIFRFCLTLIFLFTINAHVKAQDKEQYLSKLVGDSTTWWHLSSLVFVKDDVLSNGWQFCKNNSFKYFRYSHNSKKRELAFRFAEEHDELKNPTFELAGDTLKIIYFYYPSEEDIEIHSLLSNGYKNYSHKGKFFFGFKFQILRLDEEILVLHELNRWSVQPPFSQNYCMDTLIFFKARDGNTSNTR